MVWKNIALVWMALCPKKEMVHETKKIECLEGENIGSVVCGAISIVCGVWHQQLRLCDWTWQGFF